MCKYLQDEMEMPCFVPTYLATDTITQTAIFGGRKGVTTAANGANAGQVHSIAPTSRPVLVETLIADLEEGWIDSVDLLTSLMMKQNMPLKSCHFTASNILEPFDSVINTQLKKFASNGVNLVVFSFVLLENFVYLTEKKYDFVIGLFAALPCNTLVIIVDSSDRQFPALIACTSPAHGSLWEWFFERTISAKNVLIMRKISILKMPLPKYTPAYITFDDKHEATRKTMLQERQGELLLPVNFI